jgi:hypothetical protein
VTEASTVESESVASRACVCTNPEFRARHLIREYMCFSPSEVVAMERVEGSIFPDH